MGFNTTVMLHNDQTNRWPEEIKQAMQAYAPHWSDRRERHGADGYFGYGYVVATQHADYDQVCVVSGNWGRLLTPCNPVQREADLKALAEVLRGHGYTVRAPGRTRGEGPLLWGWAAQQTKETESQSARADTEEGGR